MSLVAYDASDESENEEVDEELLLPVETIKERKNSDQNKNNKAVISTKENEEIVDEPKFVLGSIPKPESTSTNCINIDADLMPLPRKVDYGDLIEKPTKKVKGPAKISIPSLSEFKDLEEEDNKISSKRTLSKQKQSKSSLINQLPPPKCSLTTALSRPSNMIPHVLTKKPIEKNFTSTIKTQSEQSSTQNCTTSNKKAKIMSLIKDSNSDSEDEDASTCKSDFFSLTTPYYLTSVISSSSINEVNDDVNQSNEVDYENKLEEKTEPLNVEFEENSGNTLVSTVMNLPKQEILSKNKAEIGPKLPVPEQEYNVDSEGNVAFDDKAIEYLCGKRGVKRKNELSNVDIVEISGEDIKPDEREWLVKALTEEPALRPVSAGTGPGGQSKKKHQITYLAHQAKAMELELKNQWAQNKANKQQTRAKYGF